MLLALAGVSSTLLAMPPVASANWGVDPENQTFSGTAEFGTLFTAAGEPAWGCEGPDHVSGAWTNGTEGSFSFDATKCFFSFFGTRAGCRTAGAPTSETILATGKFKNVTIEGGKRGITVTPSPTTIFCLFAPLKVSGTMIGRVTQDPVSCPEGNGKIDSSITLEFLTSGGVQTPLKVDNGSLFEADDLTAQTENGSSVSTAALDHRFIVSSSSNTTWTCNAP